MDKQAETYRIYLDALLSNPELSASIDNSKIAVIGHSAGGFTALVTAGGVADTGQITELCRSGIQLDESFCSLGSENEIRSVKISNQAHKRIKAVVLMAPVGILFKSKGSLAQVDIPVLLLRAGKDEVPTERQLKAAFRYTLLLTTADARRFGVPTLLAAADALVPIDCRKALIDAFGKTQGHH